MAQAKRWALMAAKLGVSVALVVWLLATFGVEDAWDRIAGIDASWLAFALLMGAVQMVVCGYRWRAVAAAIGESPAASLLIRYFYIGAFFNQTLPGSVGGDAVRIYKVYRNGMAFGEAFNGVMLDRVATVLALVLVAAVAAEIGAGDLGSDATAYRQGVWLVFALAMAGTGVLMLLDRLPASLARYRVVRGLTGLAADTRRTFLKPGASASVLTWSVLGHVNLSVLVYGLAQGLELDISLWTCLMLFPPVLLAQTIPVSIAGWGVRESAMVALFALAGVEPEAALALSIVYGVTVAAVSLPGGLVWLADGGRMPEATAAPESANEG